MSEMYKEIYPEEYNTRFKEGGEAHLLLDVRTTEEYEEIRIPGAVHIPLDEVMSRLDEITGAAGDTPIVLVCRSGGRSAMAAQALRGAGLADADLYNLETGTMGWAKQDFPTEQG